MSGAASLDARIAALILEELALRNGRCKLKYLKTYRAVRFWMGAGKADYIIERLALGGYLEVAGEYVVLKRDIRTRRSLQEVVSSVKELIQQHLASRQS